MKEKDHLHELAEKTNYAFSLLDNIEKTQGRRRFKLRLKAMWSKVKNFFRRRKNEQKITKGKLPLGRV